MAIYDPILAKPIYDPILQATLAYFRMPYYISLLPLVVIILLIAGCQRKLPMFYAFCEFIFGVAYFIIGLEKLQNLQARPQQDWITDVRTMWHNNRCHVSHGHRNCSSNQSKRQGQRGTQKELKTRKAIPALRG